MIKDFSNITAVEARSLLSGIDWDEFVQNKIGMCNNHIREVALRGARAAHVDLWCREKYVWDKLIAHFKEKGFEVEREWSGLVIKW